MTTAKTEIHQLSASALAQHIADKTITAREALDHYMERVQRLDSRINAVVVRDIETARARADAADAAVARGEIWGPLHGVPMTIKDTFEVAGMATVVGEPRLKGNVSKRDATSVARLKAAGAVVFGKTNTPRMAQDVQAYNSVYGTTDNPWNSRRTSGGSSGGAAAALAGRLTALELGSDLAGSIRTPASWCGVYGHKPSYGIVSMRGHIPAAPDLCVAGPLARSAEDLELALDVLAGPDDIEANAWRVELPAAKPQSLADFRVGYLFADTFAPIDDAVAGPLDAALRLAQNAGATCRQLDGLPGGFEDSYDVYDQLLNAMVGGGLPEKLYTKAKRGALLMSMLRKTERGTLGGFATRATDSHRAWLMHDQEREKIRRRWQDLFADYDVVLMPCVPVPAIVHNHKGGIFDRHIQVNGEAKPYTHLFRWIAPATLAGLPATTSPAGCTDDGLPIGLQIVANYGHDRTAIAFARHLAEAGLVCDVPPGFE